ncbi:MAG: hypothetical protein U0667_10560 [Chloroflexota bacterium]
MTLLVVAPPAPVAWSPGTAPLSETLRARVLAGAGTVAERAVAVMPASGRRMVAVPVGTAMRRIGIPDAHGHTVRERIAIPVATPSVAALTGAVAPPSVAALTGAAATPSVAPLPAAVARPSVAPLTGAPAGHAPWATAVMVPGVTIRTSQVPADWLRPPAPSRGPVPDAAPGGIAAWVAPAPATPPRTRVATRPAERPLPASARIRRAAVMAVGLLVSLVAVEAAARVGRR